MRWAIRILIVIAAVLSVKRALFFDGYTDFNVYYDYATKVRELWFGKSPPSFGVEPTNTSPFRYLPIWGVAFLPLSFLWLGAARAVFVATQWGIYALIFTQVEKSFRLKPWQQAVLFLGTFRFAWDNAKIGQVSALLVAFLWWAMPKVWDESGRARFLALAVSLKLQPIGLLAIAIVKRRLGFLLAFGVASLALVAASFAVGIDALESWATLSFSSLAVLDPATIGNQSLYGALDRTFPEEAKLYFAGILALVALFLFRLWSKLERPTQLGWLMGLAFLPIFGGLTWKNTYLLNLVPLAFMLARNSKWAIVLAFGFAALSQGLIGEDLNALSLHYGALPVFATIGWLAAFHFMVAELTNATKTIPPSRTLPP